MTNSENDLEKAIEIDDFTKALSLIDSGVGTINSTDRSGATLLMRAAVAKNINILQEAIEHGADLGAQDRRGMTALHFAASSGNEEAVQALVVAGADVNQQEKNGNTPAHRAFAFRTDAHKNILNFLLINGADFSIKNNAGVALKDLMPQ